ncbi:hypothetical protein ACVWZ4_001146 [Bradyrhizobium sp. USDA 4472]
MAVAKPGGVMLRVKEASAFMQSSAGTGVRFAARASGRTPRLDSARAQTQAALEQKIREICHVRIRYGYRRVHVLLRREGWRHGQNKTRRIYRELGPQLRNKTPKRQVKAKLRDDSRPATRVNETWAMDFVHDQLATGHKLRVLTIVDIFSRFSPVLQPQFSFRGSHVVAILERACKEVGFPATIRVDQGSEFVNLTYGPTNAVSRWTSPGPASQPTTRSSRPSTAASGSNVSTPTGSCPLRTPRKSGDLARYYNEERRLRRDRQSTADFAAQPRRRNQPANVTEAQNSSSGLSKVRSRYSKKEALAAAG